MKKYPFTLKQFYKFYLEASKATYAAGKPPEKRSERPGFIEWTYQKGNFHYRDSYTGFYRSRGMEVIRYKNTPVWAFSYGGGMVEGKEKLAQKTFDFLKDALSNKANMSVRGPDKLHVGKWHYTYKQKGDIAEFTGFEEISYKGEKVFFHTTTGGLIIHK